MEQRRTVDAVISGGGLAGLTAAAFLSRAGRSVVLVEKGRELGGRASTSTESNFNFNLGPHALYVAGEARAALGELGVPFRGGRPGASGGLAIRRGAAFTLPGGLLSLMTTGLLGVSGKLEVARLLATLPRLDPAPLDGISVDDWLRRSARDEDVRLLIEALVRVSTYANAPDALDAGVAVRQLQRALGTGVLYLDGGWQTIVDGLRSTATAAGATILLGQRVVSVLRDHGRVSGVELSDGTTIASRAVVATGSPEDVAELVGTERTSKSDEALRIACLDLALRSLPVPRATFALGLDVPLYFSVHSASAKLGPDGGALVHVAKYLPQGHDAAPQQDLAELERLLDLVQPGWRDLVVFRRFLPRLAAAHSFPRADSGGLGGRPSVAVKGTEGLFQAGDWVGPNGMLADASMASAREAALLADKGLGLPLRTAA